MEAYRHGYSKCVELLLHAGADVYADIRGWTALKHAVTAYEGDYKPKGVKFHKAAECIAFLVNGGADVHLKIMYEGCDTLWIILYLLENAIIIR